MVIKYCYLEVRRSLPTHLESLKSWVYLQQGTQGVCWVYKMSHQPYSYKLQF